MKHKSSKPLEPLARVSITAKAPDADQIEQWLKDPDPAHRAKLAQHFAKLYARRVKRAEASRRAAEKVNKDQREKTNRRKQNARLIIGNLIKKDRSLRLPGKQTKLAKSVQAHWPKHEDAPAIRTLRHWFAEMRFEK